jgi:hypothetical protein
MLYEMVFTGKIQGTRKAFFLAESFLKSREPFLVFETRPTQTSHSTFVGSLIRNLLALPARLASASGLLGEFSPNAFCALFRPLPVWQRAFFYGPVPTGNCAERAFAGRPGLSFV